MQSFDEIYQQHAKTVYKYLLSLTYQADLAEELTQETFYQAIRT
ncbi:MAG: RNA polymerase subunit sigma, partial [Clostridiales bacterium]|nr:RNA polymerase subunit sigma [Clostridiales bacterium]